ncbi:Rieske (2Fe-2S) protein [Ferruginibacter yonginensis]|uniref:Rieske (2Fe-2S) protein n=1 Tax=Ferruginibacter yonginensis TaxID=1310416 RepID=A0ABV8QW60_9BACT
MSKQYEWFKIAESLEALTFNIQHLAEVQVNGKHVCIALHQNNVFACAAKCPHASGKMSEGYIDALGNIVCPLHRYKFALSTGRNVSGEGYFLKNYAVEVRPNGVFIGFEKNSMFNWLK